MINFVHIFKNTGNSFELNQVLEKPSTVSKPFGETVKISHDYRYIVVGISYYNSKRGIGYIYEMINGEYSHVLTLTKDDTLVNRMFSSLAITPDANTIVAGALDDSCFYSSSFILF